MTPFELAEPHTVEDAVALLDAEDASVRPIAGGTALMLMMKAGLFRPRRLVSLRRIRDELAGIRVSPAGELHLGAMTPLAAVQRAQPVHGGWPAVTRALRTLANVRVRNVATVGGSLAHADPHMDLPPLLSALGASVSVVGPAGRRVIPVERLATGYMETALRRDELIVSVSVPALAGRRAAYVKCTTRSADDWPALGIAASLAADGDGIRDARLFLGAATDTPARLAAAEAVLRGSPADEKTLARAGEAASAELRIAGDAHGSAAYKKQLVRVYVGRAVRAALAPRAAAGERS